ncbi:nuclear transport factor 2 family protein [uncultured Tenacibaculum sp.]|uniref:nuclear transport factor 2 family protein n=1 Tax=uncultured Tenacibaculum sp. TaxID=174713 RepID=UPI002603F661|nr:nuclear transport factor 2 family protein [uncultured Tenacibaculum sp.]
MRIPKVFLATIIIVFLSSCNNVDRTNKNIELTKETLLETITQFNTAFQKGDVAILKTMITDNYIHTNGSSQPIKKEDWLGYLSKRQKQIATGNIEVLAYKMDEVQIEFFGSTAIVSAKITTTNKENNEVTTKEYRVTNVWVLQNGNWKRAGFHDGKI